MHTGFRPGQGGLTYPGLGSIISMNLGRQDGALPNFVTTGRPLNKYDFVTDPGYLGPQHGALIHADPDAVLENLEARVPEDVFALREQALAKTETEFRKKQAGPAVEGRRAVYERTLRLMRSEAAQAFDLKKESDSVRESYGSHPFGRGCLLARRLVEVGVPFVEVYLENWDTHEKKSADAVLGLMPVVDQAMAALVADLSDRGLLQDTLVVWMGEFGRTPRINRNGGRDHYAKAWSTVLAGGGIRGGQAIGRTDGMAASVAERPVSAPDFLATVCRVLGIDPRREIKTPIGRPVTVVDKSAVLVSELF
jgi:hypothetical protein